MLRKLTLWEKMFHRMNKELMGHNSLVTVMQINGNLDEKTFTQTANVLFEKHPHLRAQIKQSGNEYLVGCDAVFPDIPITYSEIIGEHNFSKFQQEAFEKSIETEKYTWRVQCFKIKDQAIAYLIFSFSHAMIDGLSAYAIAKDFIKTANQIKLGTFTNVEKLPLTVLIEEELSSAIHAQNTRALDFDFHWPYQVKNTQIENRSTGNINALLDVSELSHIRPILKKQKLSINDFLNGVLVKTLRKYKPDSLSKVVLHTPISLRSLGEIKVGPEHVLCATRLVNTYHQLENANVKDILSNALDYQRQLLEKIKQQDQQPQDEINTDIRLESYINRCKVERDGFFMGFCISNLGVLNFETELSDPFQIQSFNFSGSRQASDCIMFINVATYGGKLHLTFNFTKPMLTHSWVKSFAEDFLNEISTFNQALSEHSSEHAFNGVY